MECRVCVQGLEHGPGGGGATLAHDPVPVADVGAVGPVKGGQLGGALRESAGPRGLEPRVVIAHCVTSLDNGHGVQFLDKIINRRENLTRNIT